MLLVSANPTPEEEANRKRFQTYLNYINSIASFLSTSYDKPDLLCKEIVSSRAFAAIQGGKCINPDKLAKLLRNAWFTELQLGIAASNHDFIVYSNHWAPVQVYYSAYLSMRAFLIAGGNEASGDHTSTLAAMATQIRQRNGLFPAPWGILCDGDPYNTAGHSYIGLPKGVVPGKVSALTKADNVDFIDSYAMFLRTTRRRLIEKRCDDWKRKEGKQKVSTKAKRAFISNLAPTSIFDAMYRLRLRSNYADVDSFLLTLDMDREALELNQAMQKLTWYTALLLELLTARYIGKRAFENLVNHFADKETASLSKGLVKKRCEIIASVWR